MNFLFPLMLIFLLATGAIAEETEQKPPQQEPLSSTKEKSDHNQEWPKPFKPSENVSPDAVITLPTDI